MNTNTNIDLGDELINPLDFVEDILTAHNWVFNRMNEDELTVQVTGQHCDYRLFFIWQQDMSALQFCVQYDMVLNRDNMDNAAKALMHVNQNLWMGHFDLPKETEIPTFRHTCLLRGVHGSHAEHIEDLVDIALTQCEKYFPTFHYLCDGAIASNDLLSLALMETNGHA